MVLQGLRLGAGGGLASFDLGAGEVEAAFRERLEQVEEDLREALDEIEKRKILEDALKEDIREREREREREEFAKREVDMEYLKNIILKLLETGEWERLLPVIATLLKLSPAETARVEKLYKDGNSLLPSVEGAQEYASAASKSLYESLPSFGGGSWLSR